jgi:Golgi phosphoprotein 3
MLSFVEETTLLLLDDESGEFIDMPVSEVSTVIAGAALMDLAIHHRVDTSLETLTVVDKTATGDSILDGALAQLGHKPEDAQEMRILDAIDRVAQKAQDYIAEALKRLTTHGILRQDSDRFLWVFHTRRYPVIDDREEQEVKVRLRQILLTDEKPDHRDVVLICLVAACELMELILTPEELARAEPRIEQLRKMDLIGQAVGKAVREIEFIFRYATSAA